jgi:hypothetical protein
METEEEPAEPPVRLTPDQVEDAVVAHAQMFPDWSNRDALQSCCRWLGLIGFGEVGVMVCTPLQPATPIQQLFRKLWVKGALRFICPVASPSGAQSWVLFLSDGHRLCSFAELEVVVPD